MILRPYPTRNGLAVPTAEVNLPQSRLNPNNPKNYNNHHLEFSKRMFGRSSLLMTLRDLEGLQEPLLMDTHNQGKNTLHTIYGPPKLPTPRQTMDRIDQAYQTGEELQIWNDELKIYVRKPISDITLSALKTEYYKTR